MRQSQHQPEESPDKLSEETQPVRESLETAIAVLSEPVTPAELMPEFETLSAMGNLLGIMQIHAISALTLISSRIWQSYRRQQFAPEFFPEMLSFARGNSQFVRHEFSTPVYSFIHGSQQSGDHQNGQWGGSGFSWGAVGFAREQVMFGLMLSKQKLNLFVSQASAMLRTESQNCYSLFSFKLGNFDVITVGGVSWPDFRYRAEEANDRFVSSQWLGYAALSRRVPTRLAGFGFTVSPSLEILKAYTSTHGHNLSDKLPGAMNIEQVQSEIRVIQTGLTMDFQFGPVNREQIWQIYLGWQTSQGNQTMMFSTEGLPGNYQSGIVPAQNILLNIGASQSLGKLLSVQLSINGSWGNQGNHLGVSVSYSHQF